MKEMGIEKVVFCKDNVLMFEPDKFIRKDLR